jgi:hypothetical protein
LELLYGYKKRSELRRYRKEQKFGSPVIKLRD